MTQHVTTKHNLSTLSIMARRIAFFRREGRLEEALVLAESLLAATGGQDREICNQMFWVLYDTAKSHSRDLSVESRAAIMAAADRMQSFMHFFSDEGMHAKAIATLRRLAAMNPELTDAIHLSREPGKEAEAYRRAVTLIPVTPANGHEEIGWIIYRFLKSIQPTLPSGTEQDDRSTAESRDRECREALGLYLSLGNPRPSMLHSYILWRAVRQGISDPLFDFTDFFFTWNPAAFRPEDSTPPEPVQDNATDTTLRRPAMSLVDHAVRLTAHRGGIAMMRRLVFAIGQSSISPGAIATHFRAAAFFAVRDALRERRHETAAGLIEEYRTELCAFGPDEYHSRMLGLAIRTIPRTDHRKFLDFISAWDCRNLRDSDWLVHRGDDGRTYDGPAACLMRRLSRTALALPRNERAALDAVTESLFDMAATRLAHDRWFMRDYARLLIRRGRREEAWEIGRGLARTLMGRFFYWSGMAECATEPSARVALLCRAITMQRNESFLRRIRLDLSAMLVHLGRRAEARTELDRYFRSGQHGQRHSTKALALYDMLRDQPPSPDGNAALYSSEAPRASVLIQGPCPLI